MSSGEDDDYYDSIDEERPPRRCPNCRGKGYEVVDGSTRVTCPDCEGGGLEAVEHDDNCDHDEEDEE